MKKINFFLCAVALTVLGSCSLDKDLTADQIEDQALKPVKFSASVPAVKASEVKLTDLAKSSFEIDAYYSDESCVEKYFSAASLTFKNGTWTCSQKAWWPRGGMLTFFSHYPESLEVVYPSEITGDRMAPSFDHIISNQVDVLYATTRKSGASAYDGTPGGTTVNINLRHALSQICFSVENTNPDWSITISNIKIASILSSGHFNYPEDNDGQGVWSNLSDSYDFPVEFPTTEISGKAENVVLTNSESGAVFMIPQTRNSWVTSDKKNDAQGTYFVVNCRIVQKLASGASVQIWPSTPNALREVAVPVSIAWEQGKKYTYTLSFGKGAGYVPPTEIGGGGESVIPGQNTLSEILYSVDVSDFDSETGKVTL